jgi:hypothetical protein
MSGALPMRGRDYTVEQFREVLAIDVAAGAAHWDGSSIVHHRRADLQRACRKARIVFDGQDTAEHLRGRLREAYLNKSIAAGHKAVAKLEEGRNRSFAERLGLR